MGVKRITFGAYTLAYSGTSDDTDERSTVSIVLSESNQTGGIFFISLSTGNIFHSHK